MVRVSARPPLGWVGTVVAVVERAQLVTGTVPNWQPLRTQTLDICLMYACMNVCMNWVFKERGGIK